MKRKQRVVGKGYPVTPDGRYFVVRGRLWRMTDPGLSVEAASVLRKALMKGRATLGKAQREGDAAGRAKARAAIDRAKKRLGERGEVWWTDGEKDWNRFLVKNTPYAGWWEGI